MNYIMPAIENDAWRHLWQLEGEMSEGNIPTTENIMLIVRKAMTMIEAERELNKGSAGQDAAITSTGCALVDIHDLSEALRDGSISMKEAADKAHFIAILFATKQATSETVDAFNAITKEREASRDSVGTS